MNIELRLAAVKRAMELAESYKKVQELLGTLTPEAQALVALADEYEELCEIVTTQNQTILEMTAERNGCPAEIEKVPAETPEESQTPSKIFDIVPNGNTVTIEPSE